MGYWDIINVESNNIRTETIDAVEDAFVLFVPKAQFLWCIIKLYYYIIYLFINK